MAGGFCIGVSWRVYEGWVFIDGGWRVYGDHFRVGRIKNGQIAAPEMHFFAIQGHRLGLTIPGVTPVGNCESTASAATIGVAGMNHHSLLAFSTILTR